MELSVILDAIEQVLSGGVEVELGKLISQILSIGMEYCHIGCGA